MRKWLGVSLAWARSFAVLFTSLAVTGCGALLTPHYHLERAQREMKSGKWQDAAFDLHAVLVKEPKNSQAWLLLTRVSLDVGDPNGAASALAHARAVGVTGPEADELQARTWLASGKAQALLDALGHRTISPTEPDRTLFQARALLETGHTDQAVSILQPLVAQHPLTEAQDLLAQSLAQTGKVGEALTQLDTAEKLDPQSPEPPLLVGRIQASLGQFAAAEGALAQSLKRMPPSEPVVQRVTALAALTESRLALGRLDAAARSQAELAKLEPLAPETMLLDARIKLAHKDLIGATDELERVVADAPTFVAARMLLGAVLAQRGELQQAQQQLDQVLAVTPDNLEARKLLADVQLKLGQPGAALSVLTPALDARSLDPQLLSLFGTAARRSGNSQALIEALERNQRAHPHDQAAAINLAGVYLSTGHAAQALSLLENTPDDRNLHRDQLLIAAILAARGPDAAEKEVQALLAAHPRDPAMLDLAASYAVSESQLDRARVLLSQALTINPDDTASLIGLARVEQAQGDMSAAQSRLSAALSTHPDAIAVRLALASALVQTRSFAQARTVLESAQGAARTSPDVQFGLVQVALAEGDLTQANAALDRAIASQPGRTELVEEAGLLLMRADQYDAALGRFARATTLEPDNALYWLNTARAQLALNQPAAARASLEKAAQVQPSWLPVVSALALIDLRQGNGQAALSRIDALLATQPKDPETLAVKGDLELALHQPDAAMEAYAAAQRIRPSAAVAVKLYEARLGAHTADPIQPLEEWLKQAPNDWRVRAELANYYLLVAHSPPQAIPELQAVLRQAPNNVVALNNLAWIFGRTHDPRAEAMAERAYHLAPGSAGVNDTLGWILAQKGQGAQALPYLERAVKLAPQDPELSYHYAYVLSKSGQRAQARQILSKILASPQPFDARHEAQQLLASLGAA